MTAITHEKHTDFNWTPLNLSLSILMGVAVTAALWFSAGLLIMLFLL